MKTAPHMKKPPWLRKHLPTGPGYEKVRRMMTGECLHTVCQEAKCPNQWECFSRHTATFLIMGDHCTRNCRFCAVPNGPLGKPDPKEPERVAEAARSLGLDYVVVTSVTRDDLPDGGARFFADTIQEIHCKNPGADVEVLIPDFQGDEDALSVVLDADPAVLNHNIETVERLYPRVRPGADYPRSLRLLARTKALNPAIPRKSGIMLGLGEEPEEVKKTLHDLFEAGCRLLTIGQYLQPSDRHLPVERFVLPEEFETWRTFAVDLGFLAVSSGPFVRSSYKAEEMYKAVSGHVNDRRELWERNSL
jgi:lipoyl synthase